MRIFYDDQQYQQNTKYDCPASPIYVTGVNQDGPIIASKHHYSKFEHHCDMDRRSERLSLLTIYALASM